MKNWQKTLVLLVLIPVLAPAVTLTKLQTLSIKNHTRLVFSLGGSTQYRCFTLSKPNRLVVDLTDTHFAKVTDIPDFKNTMIQSMRDGRHQNDLRVVFELKQPITPKPYTQKIVGKKTRRLIIDLMTPKKESKIKKYATQNISDTQLRNAIVVIDPGHGGHDTGAIGERGTYEKTVVLGVAKDLYTYLRKQPGIHPVLTRKGDYFVTLRERLKLARKGQADLFVAIHADAYRTSEARGASVYALSRRGATSEAARWLAQKENTSELMGGVDLSDKSYLLRSVLLDLSQTATIRDSLTLGADVLQALKHVAKLHRYRVEQARFVVLKSPDIPSLLVETGFISNRREELKMRSHMYQHKLAHALMLGIVDYLKHHAPRDTILGAERLGSIHHKVKSGESLSRIATHYGTMVSKLKSENHLETATIHPGQILKIPKLH